MICNKLTKLCPDCGSLRFRYGKRAKEFKCYACRSTFLTPIEKPLPYRNGRCVHMDPAARLVSNYAIPELPGKKAYTPKESKWYAKVKGIDKMQTIMIFETDPDPWRLDRVDVW